MEKPSKSILIIISALVLLSAISILQNFSLKNDIQNLRSSFDNMTSTVQNNIYSINDNVSTMLDEKASILAYQNYTEGAFNPENLTISVDFSVIPKEYTSSTTAAIWYNGKSYPMTLKSGEFFATVELPIDTSSYDAKVEFIDGSTKRTELLNFYGDYAEKFLNSYYSNLDGISWSNMDSATIFQLHDCIIRMDPQYYNYDNTNDQSILQFTNMVFHAEVNDKEVFSKAIDTSNSQFNGENDGPPLLLYNLLSNKEIKVPANSSFEFFITYTDHYGLNHKNILYGGNTDSEGQLTEDYYSQNVTEIYNREGKLIYSNND